MMAPHIAAAALLAATPPTFSHPQSEQGSRNEEPRQQLADRLGSDFAWGATQALTESEIEALRTTLQLDTAQAKVIRTFADAANGALAALSDTPQSLEQGGHGLDFGAALAQGQKLDDARDEIRQRFFEDVKSVLDEGQVARWPAYERAARRATLLPRPDHLSSEQIDLADLITRLDLTAEQMESLTPTIEKYHEELDVALVARQDALDHATQRTRQGNPAGGGTQAGIAMLAQAQQKRVAIRDLNDRYEQVFESSLPADKGRLLHDLYLRTAFANIFSPTRATRTFDGVMKLADLTAEQRALLSPIQSAYEAQLVQINEEMVRTKREIESQTGLGAMRPSEDGTASDRMQALSRQRETVSRKTQLDSETLEKIRAILTEHQRSMITVPGVNWRSQESQPAPVQRPESDSPAQDPHGDGG